MATMTASEAEAKERFAALEAENAALRAALVAAETEVEVLPEQIAAVAARVEAETAAAVAAAEAAEERAAWVARYVELELEQRIMGTNVAAKLYELLTHNRALGTVVALLEELAVLRPAAAEACALVAAERASRGRDGSSSGSASGEASSGSAVISASLREAVELEATRVGAEAEWARAVAERDVLAARMGVLEARREALAEALEAERAVKAAAEARRAEKSAMEREKERVGRQVSRIEAALRDGESEVAELKRQARVYVATSFELTEAIRAVDATCAVAEAEADALAVEVADAVAAQTKAAMAVRRVKRNMVGVQMRKYELQAEVIAAVGEKNELILRLEEAACAGARLDAAEGEHEELKAECAAELARNRRLDEAVEAAQAAQPVRAKRRSIVGLELEAKLRELESTGPEPVVRGARVERMSKVSAQSLFDAAAAAAEEAPSAGRTELWSGPEVWDESGISSESPEESTTCTAASASSGGERVEKATVPQLIELMTHPRRPHLSLVAMFLRTYREYTTVLEVIELLIMRYCVSSSSGGGQLPIRVRVYNLLRTWLTKYPADFAGHDEAVAVLGDFCGRVMAATGMAGPGEKLCELLAGVGAEREADVAAWDVVSVAADEISLAKASKKDVYGLAVALCVLDADAFGRVDEMELLGRAWMGAEKAVRAPGVLRVARWASAVTMAIQYLVLREDGVRAMAKALRKAVLLVDALVALGNLGGAVAVGAALLSGPLQTKGAKSAWAKVSPSTDEMWARALSVISHEHGYGGLRAAIAAAGAPVIPFLGMYLSDLVFAAGGLGSGSSAGDMGRWWKYGDVVNEVVRLRDGVRGKRAWGKSSVDVERWSSVWRGVCAVGERMVGGADGAWGMTS